MQTEHGLAAACVLDMLGREIPDEASEIEEARISAGALVIVELLAETRMVRRILQAVYTKKD